ncbi:hypothetical protein C2S51_033283 [Perilla frutescens var. frutescens]|nr:hypothetical protein C2S51_033283 [Perilla frutescens var. frutescens]
MAATAVTGSCNTTTFFPISLPKPPPSQKFFPLPRQLLHSYKRTTPQICSRSAPNSAAMSPRSVSSPENGVVTEEEEERAEQNDDAVSSSSPSLPPLTSTIHSSDFTKLIPTLSTTSGVVKGAEERRSKGVVMVKEGFKGGLPLSRASVGGRSKLIGLARLTCNPVGGTDEPAKAWMKSSPAGPANEELATLICSKKASVFTSSDKILSKSFGSMATFTFQTPFPGGGSTSTAAVLKLFDGVELDFILTTSSFGPCVSAPSVTALREQFPIADYFLIFLIVWDEGTHSFRRYLWECYWNFFQRVTDFDRKEEMASFFIVLFSDI